MQTKKHSIIEVFTSTLVAYLITLIAQPIVFALFNYHPTHTENMAIGLIFTGISLVRNYIMRRVFNCVLCKG